MWETIKKVKHSIPVGLYCISFGGNEQYLEVNVHVGTHPENNIQKAKKEHREEIIEAVKQWIDGPE